MSIEAPITIKGYDRPMSVDAQTEVTPAMPGVVSTGINGENGHVGSKKRFDIAANTQRTREGLLQLRNSNSDLNYVFDLLKVFVYDNMSTKVVENFAGGTVLDISKQIGDRVAKDVQSGKISSEEAARLVRVYEHRATKAISDYLEAKQEKTPLKSLFNDALSFGKEQEDPNQTKEDFWNGGLAEFKSQAAAAAKAEAGGFEEPKLVETIEPELIVTGETGARGKRLNLQSEFGQLVDDSALPGFLRDRKPAPDYSDIKPPRKVVGPDRKRVLTDRKPVGDDRNNKTPFRMSDMFAKYEDSDKGEEKNGRKPLGGLTTVPIDSDSRFSSQEERDESFRELFAQHFGTLKTEEDGGEKAQKKSKEKARNKWVNVGLVAVALALGARSMATGGWDKLVNVWEKYGPVISFNSDFRFGISTHKDGVENSIISIGPSETSTATATSAPTETATATVTPKPTETATPTQPPPTETAEVVAERRNDFMLGGALDLGKPMTVSVDSLNLNFTVDPKANTMHGIDPEINAQLRDYRGNPNFAAVMQTAWMYPNEGVQYVINGHSFLREGQPLPFDFLKSLTPDQANNLEMVLEQVMPDGRIVKVTLRGSQILEADYFNYVNAQRISNDQDIPAYLRTDMLGVQVPRTGGESLVWVACAGDKFQLGDGSFEYDQRVLLKTDVVSVEFVAPVNPEAPQDSHSQYLSEVNSLRDTINHYPDVHPYGNDEVKLGDYLKETEWYKKKQTNLSPDEMTRLDSVLNILNNDTYRFFDSETKVRQAIQCVDFVRLLSVLGYKESPVNIGGADYLYPGEIVPTPTLASNEWRTVEENGATWLVGAVPSNQVGIGDVFITKTHTGAVTNIIETNQGTVFEIAHANADSDGKVEVERMSDREFWQMIELGSGAIVVDPNKK